MPKKVYLIGTVHVDIQGPLRLSKLLYICQPDVIFCEGYKSGGSYAMALDKLSVDGMTEVIKIQFPKYSKNAKTIASVLKVLDFERMISKRYAAEHDIQVIQKDSLVGCMDIINNLEKELGTREGMEKMLKNFATPIGRHIDDTNVLYHKNYENVSNGVGEHREKIWAKEIRKQKGTVVAVAGNGHIFRKAPCLYDILADLDVERIMLCDADKL